MVARGELWWIDFGQPLGSAPGYRRPAVIVSSDRFNRSRIATVMVAAVTSNLRLARAPGNVALPETETALPKASVVNVSKIIAVDRGMLETRVCRLSAASMRDLERGLRLVLAL